jgi:hypothetical protein
LEAPVRVALFTCSLFEAVAVAVAGLGIGEFGTRQLKLLGDFFLGEGTGEFPYAKFLKSLLKFLRSDGVNLRAPSLLGADFGRGIYI